jgi:hypothetical protein
VVCSGINDRVDAHPQPSAGAGIRDEVTRSADYYPFRSSEESGTKPIFQD